MPPGAAGRVVVQGAAIDVQNTAFPADRPDVSRGRVSRESAIRQVSVSAIRAQGTAVSCGRHAVADDHTGQFQVSRGLQHGTPVRGHAIGQREIHHLECWNTNMLTAYLY